MAGQLSEYENILLDLKDHEDILDTILYYLQKDLSEKQQEAAAEIQKEDFKELMEALNSLYAYDIVDTDEYSKRQLFVLGGIWGAMGLYQKIAEKEKTTS